jgi:hypothetical protein
MYFISLVLPVISMAFSASCLMVTFLGSSEIHYLSEHIRAFQGFRQSFNDIQNVTETARLSARRCERRAVHF